MPLIPNEELERLKREVSLVRLAEGRGVELKAHGKDLMGLCPFHEDREPSLVISPEKNLWHCLGACQSGGSVIDWVMRAEGVSFRHAVELLRKDAYTVAAEDSAPSKRPVKQSTVQKLSSVVDADVDVQRQVLQVIEYYHQMLKQSPEALEYLAKRGIGSSEAIDRFKLGYSNRTLCYHMPQKNRAEGAAVRQALQEVGLLRPSGHEHFSGSLVIPIFDESGRVTEVYGRKIGDRLRAGTPLHLYLPGPHRGVWNLPALEASKELILCESLIDALTFWCAGYHNVTSSYGVEGFTADHLEAFKKHGIERVLIAYDRDAAGEQAASSLAEQLTSAGMECFRINFAPGMDANEYALMFKPAEKTLGQAIRTALWIDPVVGFLETRAGLKPDEQAPSSVIPEPEPQPDDAAISPQPCDDSESISPLATEIAAPEPTAAEDREDSPETSPIISPLAAEKSDSEPVVSPMPARSSAPAVRAEQKPGEVIIELGDRRWRVRGLEKNLSYDQLRVNVLVSRGESFHVDTLELYSARHRQAYIKQASEELGLEERLVKRDLGRVFLKLEELQEQQISEALGKKESEVQLSDSERSEALAFLKSPDLLGRILSDFERCGLVGEDTNKLCGYLAAVSRKLEEPLAIVIRSSSAAGKSSLMEAILSFFPSEEQVKYSAMTGQSLFYMGETDLKHKVLAIVEEEGAERASYALKLLQSEGELTIASTGKDPSTGRLVTQEYRVEGPVMIFLTTTAVEIDEELLNRCLVLTVDEDREQTRAIHRLQRKRQTLSGLLAQRERGQLVELHQNAQRLLRPLLVANPYAEHLTFLDDRTRMRRDHMKYLTLIRAIALLHQYQRPIKQVRHQGQMVSYVEVELSDIEVANGLCHEVLGRSLDELAPQTRRLLLELDAMVTNRSDELGMDRRDFRFTRREVREYTGMGNTQAKLHMHRLEEMEYVIVHRGGRGQQFIYELAYSGEGEDGTPFLPMLLDVAKLRSHGYDANRSGPEGKKSGGGRGQVGAKSVGCRGADRPLLLNDAEKIEPKNGKTLKNAHPEQAKSESYIVVNHTHSEAVRSEAAS